MTSPTKKPAASSNRHDPNAPPTSSATHKAGPTAAPRDRRCSPEPVPPAFMNEWDGAPNDPPIQLVQPPERKASAASPAAPPERDALNRADHAEIARLLVQDLAHRFPPGVVYVKGVGWFYDPKRGIWTPIDRDVLSLHIQGFAGLPVTGKKARTVRIMAGDISGIIETAAPHMSAPDWFDDPMRGVAFKNGFATIIAGDRIELFPHKADYRCRSGLDLRYSTEEPRELLAFLHDRFADHQSPEAAATFFLEFIGVSMLGAATKLQRALVLLGDGKNGKSSLLEIAAACFPEDAVVALTPDDLANEYGRDQLSGALLNVHGDLPEIVHESSYLKASITGERLTARAIRKSPVKFRARAGHLFAANAAPRAKNDRSTGFSRRFHFLLMRRTIPAHLVKLNFARELLDRELDKIASAALRAGARALYRGHYDPPVESLEFERCWSGAPDAVVAFLDSEMRTLPDPTLGTRASELFAAFQKWRGGSPRYAGQAWSQKAFSQRLIGRGVGWKQQNGGTYYALEFLNPSNVSEEPSE